MSRLQATFAACRARGEAALVPYFTVGDPDVATTRALVRAAVAEGADVIELGVPFSDPMADGPVLQRSAVRALAAGTTLHGVLALVAELRQEITQPIVLFGYYNPFFRYGVEAAGHGLDTGAHAASLAAGEVGVLHGNKTYLLQDETGQIRNAHSISAGLDYPGVGPEHAYLRDSGQAEYVTVTDDEAVEALRLLTATEGIIPALESAHAVAHAVRLAPRLDRRRVLLVNLSGRGDKDMGTVAAHLGVGLT